MICKKHPKYKVIRKPVSDCKVCWKIWTSKYKGEKMTQGEKQYLHGLLDGSIMVKEESRQKAIERLEFAEKKFEQVGKAHRNAQDYVTSEKTAKDFEKAETEVLLATRERDRYSSQQEALEDFRTLLTQKGMI